MKIDDRKVNGRITIDREDIICTWTVLVSPMGGVWVSEIDKKRQPVLIPDSVAGAFIDTAIKAFKPVFFTIMSEADGSKILPMPAFSLNVERTRLSIDIGEVITGKTLEIALPSVTITVKSSN